MGNRFKMRCPNCESYLVITETDDIWPGCKEQEEAIYPNCHKEVYSTMTSGFVNAAEITETEYNNL